MVVEIVDYQKREDQRLVTSAISSPKKLLVDQGRKACPAELDAVRRGVPSQFLSRLNGANVAPSGTQRYFVKRGHFQ